MGNAGVIIRQGKENCPFRGLTPKRAVLFSGFIVMVDFLGIMSNFKSVMGEAEKESARRAKEYSRIKYARFRE